MAEASTVDSLARRLEAALARIEAAGAARRTAQAGERARADRLAEEARHALAALDTLIAAKDAA